MTLDKSKKVGRFRRRDRGVSHVFAIFFPNLLYAISFVIYSYLIYRPLPLLSDNQRTNEQRTRERKGSRLSLLFERHWRGGRGTSDLSSTTDHSARIRHRGMTIVEFETESLLFPPPPPCYRSRHCFHVRTQKLDDAHIIIITDEGGIRNRLRLFLWLEILLPRFIRVKIFSIILIFFSDSFSDQLTPLYRYWCSIQIRWKVIQGCEYNKASIWLID